MKTTCPHGIWKSFCYYCKYAEALQRFHDSDKDSQHNGRSGPSSPTELDRLRAQIAARDRELAALKETHAAFVAKVREFVNHAHGEHTGEDLRGYARDLAAILPAEPTPTTDTDPAAAWGALESWRAKHKDFRITSVNSYPDGCMVELMDLNPGHPCDVTEKAPTMPAAVCQAILSAEGK